VVDFEGTPTSGVIEFGIARWEGGRVEEVFTDRCRPTGPVRWADSRTHGLRGTDLKDRRPFDNYFDEFLRRRRDGLFAAHHCSVEARLLRHHWPLVPEVPDPHRPGVGCHQWGPFVDTLKVVRTTHPTLSSWDLQSVVEAFQLGEEIEALAGEMVPAGRRKWHCAPYDALATALVLRVVLESFPEWSEQELLACSGFGASELELF